jgi:aspartate racemase
LLLATNTMHKVAPQVGARSGLPLLHIGDACGLGLRAAGCRRPGLLGTRFTMEDPFLIDHLSGRYGLDVLVPSAPEREEMHRIIFDELCLGLLREASRRQLEGMMRELADRGCDSVILGCTEIALLTPPEQGPWPLPLFDTTALHAAAAVSWMLEETP